MLDIQRRHAEVFRIRLGDKAKNGAPRKLTDSIRITSPSDSVVRAFTDVFGGEVREWEGQYEAYLPTTALPIMVLPGQSIQQWWEFYKGSVCERRCDGFTEQLSGKACMCPEEITDRLAKRDACKPMTRVNVICPDVEVVGAGSLVTHGMVAAETLPQSIMVAEAALARGMMVPAVLRVIEHVGKDKRYIVPQIEIVGVSLTALTTGEAPLKELEAGTQPALEAGKPPEPPELADDATRARLKSAAKLLPKDLVDTYASWRKAEKVPTIDGAGFDVSHALAASNKLIALGEEANSRAQLTHKALGAIGVKDHTAHASAVLQRKVEHLSHLTKVELDQLIEAAEQAPTTPPAPLTRPAPAQPPLPGEEFE